MIEDRFLRNDITGAGSVTAFLKNIKGGNQRDFTQ